jgi:hypothetical protein
MSPSATLLLVVRSMLLLLGMSSSAMGVMSKTLVWVGASTAWTWPSLLLMVVWTMLLLLGMSLSSALGVISGTPLMGWVGASTAWTWPSLLLMVVLLIWLPSLSSLVVAMLPEATAGLESEAAADASLLRALLGESVSSVVSSLPEDDLVGVDSIILALRTDPACSRSISLLGHQQGALIIIGTASSVTEG